MKFKKMMEELISSEEFYENPRIINFERLARNLKNTGFTDITSFAFEPDVIDPSGIGNSVLPQNTKGVVKNDGSSRLK